MRNSVSSEHPAAMDTSCGSAQRSQGWLAPALLNSHVTGTTQQARICWSLFISCSPRFHQCSSAPGRRLLALQQVAKGRQLDAI